MMLQYSFLQISVLSFLSLVTSVHGSLSLEFLSTARTRADSGPYFQQLTVFNEVAISFCDGETWREQFKSRLKSTELPEDCGQHYADVLEFIDDVQKLRNSTVDVVQRRRGCSLSADGTVSGFELWALNGMDFLTFDPGISEWTARSPTAQRVQHLWNQNKPKKFAFSHFINHRCPEIMRKTVLTTLSENTEVQIFAKLTSVNDEVQLKCHVTSSDQSVSSVHLIGDGAPRVKWVSVTAPLPGGDGSVVLLLTAGIRADQSIYQYGCTVQTEKGNITTFWNGKTLNGQRIYYSLRDKILPAVFGCVAIIGVIIVISCTMIILLKYFKMKKQSRPPPRSELTQKLYEEGFIKSSTLYPDIRNILLSFIYDSRRPKTDL
ncbi:hypothetical protein NL108_010288 [Boleophthalmus pectinirostris]|uniref:hereditary hemochromatosis protein homolog isoform X2 n=1 Tax=Boleophthalmus pectinirostris TaxID=150288 RepID=UPI000A1C5F74|nr:hereditary hemochromatosis protein homolog isoform X2 [Boleophthalmus pectinirostris]KAJ0063002.1 hypothetical protein NL108_010288 [Boleophthalmus pectinirostris]